MLGTKPQALGLSGRGQMLAVYCENGSQCIAQIYYSWEQNQKVHAEMGLKKYLRLIQLSTERAENLW